MTQAVYIVDAIAFLCLSVFLLRIGFLAAIRFIRIPYNAPLYRASWVMSLSMAAGLFSAFETNIVRPVATADSLQDLLLILSAAGFVVSLILIYKALLLKES